MLLGTLLGLGVVVTLVPMAWNGELPEYPLTATWWQSVIVVLVGCALAFVAPRILGVRRSAN